MADNTSPLEFPKVFLFFILDKLTDYDKLNSFRTEADLLDDPFMKLSNDELDYLEKHKDEFDEYVCVSKNKELKGLQRAKVLGWEKNGSNIILTCDKISRNMITSFLHTGYKAYHNKFFKIKNKGEQSIIRVVPEEGDDFSKVESIYFI